MPARPSGKNSANDRRTTGTVSETANVLEGTNDGTFSGRQGEVAGCPNLRTHGTCRKLRVEGVLGAHLLDERLVGSAPILVDAVNVRGNDEKISLRP